MKLVRQLGFWETFCVAAGAMISSGLFVLPGMAFSQAGPGVVVSYALASLLAVPAMFSQAELATAMPQSGGSYVFIERSMGTFAGTLAGLASWLSLALKSAFALVGIGAFARLIWPDAPLSEDQWVWTVKLIAVGFCVVFAALNAYSVKMAGRAQVIMVVGLLAILALFVVAGVGSVRQHPNFDYIFAKGFGGVFVTSGLVFVSFGGLTKVAGIGGEIRNPGRTLPRAMAMAWLLVSVLYVAGVFVVVGTLSPDVLAGNLTPLSASGLVTMGPAGMILLSAAGMLAFITTGNSGILSASRNPMAMSHDGLLPASLQRVGRHGTPVLSIALTSAFMIGMLLLLDLESLVKVASTMMLVLFVLVCGAVLIMRASRIQNYRPLFRSPLFPWMQVFGIVVYTTLIAYLAAKLGPVPMLTAGGFVVGCVLWWLLYVRPRNERESALFYMVRRIIDAQIGRTGRSHLENELRELSLDREGIEYDRFDELVHRCEVLDVAGPTSSDKLFRRCAESLAPRLSMDADALEALFHEREKLSSTVLEPGLAVPHVIVPGEKRFEIVLVRCKGGIVFDPEQPYVKVVFVLVGSADERNFHLRALMAIANIVQEPGFLERWLEAPQDEHLRDLVLMSTRRRHRDETKGMPE